MNLIEEFKHDSSGLAIINEWLGSGAHPVSQARAEKRAEACFNCPLNVSPRWWEKVKDRIADEIKKHIAFKNRVGLRVSREDSLHMCKACGCANPLSVWCPIIHIAHHTDAETLEKFTNQCWKRIEIKEALK